MGRIIKYNVARGEEGERIKTVVYNSGGGSGYHNNDNPQNSNSNEISVNLWGNEFHGIEDLNSTITVTDGDIYVTLDEDFDPADYDEDDEIPTGSIYIQNKVVAKSVEAENITATANVNSNNITATNNIKSDYINAKYEINCDNNIQCFNIAVNNNCSALRLYGDDIYFNYPNADSTKQNLRDVLSNLGGTPINTPVVLWSGSLESANNNDSQTYAPFTPMEGKYCQHPYVSGININYDMMKTIPTLIIRLTAVSGYRIRLYSINASVARAMGYNVFSQNQSIIQNGGYWTTAGIESNTANIQAWSFNTNSNELDCSVIGYRVNELNVTLIGIIEPR